MPTIEYVHHHDDGGMPLAQVDDTATSKRRRLSPPQEVTSDGQPSSSAGSKAPIADSLSQLIHHYSEMATDKHTVLRNQFQHLQQVLGSSLL